MKLTKINITGLMFAVISLTSVVSLAQAAGKHGCTHEQHWSPKLKKCVSASNQHGCTKTQHWDLKAKQCVSNGSLTTQS